MSVLILGASVRAAAHSAIRAGWQPAGLDLFADRDLASLAPAWRLPGLSDPEVIESLARRAPDGPWIYTGPIENRPELVDRLRRTRPLWGMSGEALRAVRDPFRVREVLERAGLPCPAVRRGPDGLPRDGSWLVKPRASGGGRAIRPLVPAPTDPVWPPPPRWVAERGRHDSLPDSSPPRPSSARGEGAGRRGQAPSAGPRIGSGPDESRYYQERIPGRPLSGLVLAARGRSRLVALTEPRTGRPRAPFAYAGSVGPVTIGEPTRSILERQARALVTALGLVGLFGIDVIVRDGVPWPVEINPRYTASVEVVELAVGHPLLSWHRGACEGGGLPADVPDLPMSAASVIGKAILFADGPAAWQSPAGWTPPRTVGYELPRLADVPAEGTRLAAGDPVLTIFARGTSAADCHARVDRKLAAFYKRLRRCRGER